MKSWAAILLLALFSARALAQESAATPSPTPDYSKERLRFVFRDYLVPPPPPPADRVPAITVLDRWGWVFKYVPYFLGNVNDGAFGHANPMTMPDPFYMTNTSFPETKDTYRPLPSNKELTIGERRYRRAMINVTTRTNENDRD